MSLISIIIITVLMVGSIIWLVLELTKAISEPANMFLTFINQGLTDKAYEMTHSKFKENTSLNKFAEVISKYNFNQKSYTSWYTRKLRNGKGIMYGKFYFDKDNSIKILLSFLKEDKKWKITAFSIGEPNKKNFYGLLEN